MIIDKIGYKSATAINAYNRVKHMTKRQVIGFNDIIRPASKELLEKRTYMQSPEFLENADNKMKMDWGELQAALKK